MAKRKNRVAPIEHECRQLENLKVLEPNSTTPEARELSNALVDIALAALEEVRNLELGEEPQLKRLETLVELMDTLPQKVSI